MANKAISELPQAQNVNNQDLFVLEQSGIAKKLPAETFITEQGIIDALAEALDGHGGIQSVTLASVSGRIRTYRITFTDQSATTFQVYDGTSIDRISRTSSSGLDDVYTIFLSDGTTTFFTVHNGADGTVSEAMLNDALKDKAPAITETTESSAIATFSDGADDMPLHNILAEINPVQDLPYGDPYPAGSGKNMLPVTAESGTFKGVAISINKDAAGNVISVVFNNTSTGSGVFELGTFVLSAETSITLNGCPSGGNGSSTYNLRVVDSDSTTKMSDYGYASTATLAAGTYKAIITVYNGYAFSNTAFYPMIRLSSVSDATFAPYSNICPISGWTGCNVTRTGKNLFDQATVLSGLGFGLQSDGSWLYTRDSYWPVYQQKVWENATGYTGQIAVSLDVKYGTSGKIGLYFKFVYTDGTTESILGSATGDFVSTSAVSNASKTVDYIMTYFSYNVADTSTAFKNVQLELGSTATAYEPYQGNTVSLSWQTEAGTVYGGTIDVATGLLTVDRAIVTIDGAGGNDASINSSIRARYPIPNDSAVWNNANTKSGYVICNMFKEGTNAESASGVVCFHLRSTGSHEVVFGFGSSFPGVANYSQANSWISTNKPVVCYKLATPQTYQLTPQEVKTLLGTNNVWADTGNVSVTYAADTKMFIEKLTMPTEDDLVANQAITSGQYFMVGNSLYLALANIASGAQITIGTNAQRVSLADALNTINS